MGFDLSKTKIAEVHSTHDKHQANKMLQEGWVLLDTASGKDESGYPLVTYVLGLPKVAAS